MLAYLPNLAIQLPVYLPNWLPTLSCLSFWRQTGDKPIFYLLRSSKNCLPLRFFASRLRSCGEPLFSVPSLPLHTRRHRMLSWIARPFFNRPPVKGFFLVLSCDLSLYVLCSSRFSIRIFPRFAYPSFSLVYPFLLYFFTPLPVCCLFSSISGSFFIFRIFMSIPLLVNFLSFLQ